MAFTENWIVKVLLASKSHTCLTATSEQKTKQNKKNFNIYVLVLRRNLEMHVSTDEIQSA